MNRRKYLWQRKHDASCCQVRCGNEHADGQNFFYPGILVQGRSIYLGGNLVRFSTPTAQSHGSVADDELAPLSAQNTRWLTCGARLGVALLLSAARPRVLTSLCPPLPSSCTQFRISSKNC